MKWLDAYDRFAVFGLGRSGVAAANLLARRGKSVVASDLRAGESLADVRASLEPGVEIVEGENAAGDAPIVVASPGIPPGAAAFQNLRPGVQVVSEIELAWAASESRMLAITGTDGKTTTTALAEHLLKSAGLNAVAAGNIGTPLCAVVDELGPDDWIVAEVSAFQLWSTQGFNAQAAAITNIAADHLDYFESFEDYVEAKRTIFERASATDVGIFNVDDSYARSWVSDHPGVRVAYGGERFEECDESYWFDESNLHSTRCEAYFELGDSSLAGDHNALNMLCASALARNAGVAWDAIAEGLSSFRGLPHRFQYLGSSCGIDVFDDSKATNVHAALAGIRSLKRPLVVIAGGVDKGLPLGEFAEELSSHARHVVVIGAIADRLEESLCGAGLGEVSRSDSMRDAVDQALKHARPGDAILLSPACSSFDMFDSYAHRGEVFQECLRTSGFFDDE